MQKISINFLRLFPFLARCTRKVAELVSSLPNLLKEEIIQLNEHAVAKKKLRKKWFQPLQKIPPER